MHGLANLESSVQLIVLDHHNYRSIVDAKHTVADTVAFFHPKLNHIDAKLVSRYLSAEEAIRKSEISFVMANTVLDYFLKLHIFNLEVNIADLVDMAVQFQRMFELSLLPEDKARLYDVISGKCASFNSYSLEDAILTPQGEYRRLNEFFKNYSPNDTYYFDEIHINVGSKNFTVSVSGNLSASGFLDPLVVSNLPLKSFNYYPTGLLNSTHLHAYLARINLQMRLRGQKILLVLHNNVVVDSRQFSNIELLYISPEVDKYFQNNPDNCIKFPDEYGLKSWIRSHIIDRLSKLKTFDNPLLLINSILYSYSTCISKLLHDPLYFQFNQLNLMSSNFMGNNMPAPYYVNENIKITDGNLIVMDEAPEIGQYSAREDNFKKLNNYNYNVKDIYFILSSLLLYQNSDIGHDYGFDAKEIMDFLVQKVHPFLIQREFPFVGHFHRFLDEFINEYARIGASDDTDETDNAFSVSEKFHLGPLQEAARIEKILVSAFDQDGDNLASMLFPHIDSIEVANSEASFLKASARNLSNGNSLPLPTLDEYDMFTPKKRRSLTNSIPTIKKSKIIEIMKKDKLSFVNSAQGSVFSDDSDYSEDSFSSKIKQFKDKVDSNGLVLSQNGNGKVVEENDANAYENEKSGDEDEESLEEENDSAKEEERKDDDREEYYMHRELINPVGGDENGDIEEEVYGQDDDIEMEKVQQEETISIQPEAKASSIQMEVEPNSTEESSNSDSNSSSDSNEVADSNNGEKTYIKEAHMNEPTSREDNPSDSSESQSSDSSESDAEDSAEEEETHPESNSKVPLSSSTISPSQLPIPVPNPVPAPVKTSSISATPSTQIKLPRRSLGTLSSLVPPKSTVESKDTPKTNSDRSKFKGKLDFSSDDSFSSVDSDSSDESNDDRNVSQLAQVKVTSTKAVPKTDSTKSTTITNTIRSKPSSIPANSTALTKHISTKAVLSKPVLPLLKKVLDAGLSRDPKLAPSAILEHVSKPKEKRINPSQLKSIERRQYDSSSEDEMSDPINESSDESEDELFGTLPNVSTLTQRTQTQNLTQIQIQTSNSTTKSPVRKPGSPLQFSFDRNSPGQSALSPREKLQFSSQSTPASAGKGRPTILSMKLKELEARQASPSKKEIPKKGQRQTSQAKERQLSASDSDSSSEDSDDSIGF